MKKPVQFDSQFYKFLTSHEDLVGEYELKFGESLTNYVFDIQTAYENINNISKTTVKTLLENAVQQSISNNTKILETLDNIRAEVTMKGGETNSLRKYFDEISAIYRKNNNDYNIEFCAENREKLITMNLKNVIAIAKRYQNCGVAFDDLISAGNVGLVTSFDKYDPQRACLKDNMLKVIEDIENEELTYEQIKESLNPYLTYGDIQEEFHNEFHKDTTYEKSAVIRWIRRKVSNAKFSSVANMWIEAAIIKEIEDNGRLVKKPKSEIQKDKAVDGFYRKEQLVSMDAPIKADSDTPVSEIFNNEEEEVSDIELIESHREFKRLLNLLLDGIKGRDRGILLKYFGIGLPRPMVPKEIAEQEGLSIARISQIIQTVLKQMNENREKYGIDEATLTSLIHNIE